MNRLELLETVNELNVQALRERRQDRYHTVDVLYNSVVYRTVAGNPDVCVLHMVCKGVPK